VNLNFQEILTKDPSSAWGCDTSGNISPCAVALRRTCRCTEFHRVKNANLRHPSAMFLCLFVWFWRNTPQWARAASCTWFLDQHNDAAQSVGLLWTSDQLVAETYSLTTHDSHNRETSMWPVGFEPTISAGERPQNYALDRAATGTGVWRTIFFVALRPNAGHGLLILDVSRSHTTTQHSR